jgi:hypothetical protein
MRRHHTYNIPNTEDGIYYIGNTDREERELTREYSTPAYWYSMQNAAHDATVIDVLVRDAALRVREPALSLATTE